MRRRDRYGLCDQTVTVYHRSAANATTRTVYERAFLGTSKERTVERTDSEESGFLLVVPGDVPIFIGDKAVRGEGPQCTTDAQWRELIPTKVDGLVVVRRVAKLPEPHGGGAIAHTEAEG